MKENEFYQELKKLGIILTNKQKSQLEEFYQLLIEANKKINLTTITNKEDVYLKHFYDSLTLVKVIDLSKKETLLDVGTGAGMPGIVLKIVFPNLKITLLDARNKKILYLEDIIKKLKSFMELFLMERESCSKQPLAIKEKALIQWCLKILSLMQRSSMDRHLRKQHKELIQHHVKLLSTFCPRFLFLSLEL